MGREVGLTEFVAGLADTDLRHLSELLRGGRIGPGTTAAVLRSYDAPASWAGPLGALAALGWTTSLLADAVGALHAERSAHPGRHTTVVCTRPALPDLEMVDTSVIVRRLFQQAKREVWIAGFRITEREMLEPLRRPADRELDVRVFVDIDRGVDAAGRPVGAPVHVPTWPGAWWGQFIDEVWPRYLEPPIGYFAPSTLAPAEAGEWRSMHIKSVVVDRRLWFVTSANFTKRGHQRNIELGALIDDEERAAEVVRAFEEWVAGGLFVRLG
jgi:phosphatidylserine/phosphatidylglycerophosphate/cardiolipin synthase-like enzyme